MAIHKIDEMEQPIDSAMEEILLRHLTPVQPSAASRSNMLDNILQQVRKNPPNAFVTIRSDEGDWIEVLPNVYRKRLIANEKVNAFLYRMEPGSSIPGHQHTSDEECICLQGEVNLGGIIAKAGDFHLAPQGLSHGTISSPHGCLLYIRCAGDPVSVSHTPELSSQ